MGMTIVQTIGFHLGVLYFLGSFLVLTSSKTDQSKRPNNQVALFVFGDSLYDPGNNDYLDISNTFKADFPPYGETFFKFPTGRFSDGRLIPDFIAEHFNLPLWKPYLQPGHHQFTNGANFASAGAAVLSDFDDGPLNLKKQLAYFKEVASSLEQKLGNSEAKKFLAKAVYLFTIGGVDLLTYYNENTDATEAELLDRVKIVVGNLTNGIKEIYEIGGRKFAFQNEGPMGCYPMSKQSYNLSGSDCVEPLSAMARKYNSALSNSTKEMESQLPGFKYSIFDYYAAVEDRIKNPSKYGFKVVDMACCGYGLDRGEDCGKQSVPYELCSYPSEYLFWDGLHPPEHGCSQFAALFWEGSLNITGPFNIKQLYELETVADIPSEDGGVFTDE